MPAVGEVGFSLLVVETHDLLCPELRRHALEPAGEREFVIDHLLVRIHSIIEMILVDRLCAIGV